MIYVCEREREKTENKQHTITHGELNPLEISQNTHFKKLITNLKVVKIFSYQKNLDITYVKTTTQYSVLLEEGLTSSNKTCQETSKNESTSAERRSYVCLIISQDNG